MSTVNRPLLSTVLSAVLSFLITLSFLLTCGWFPFFSFRVSVSVNGIRHFSFACFFGLWHAIIIEICKGGGVCMDTGYFSEMQLARRRQGHFIELWHRKPNMSVSELSRQVGISRPTCYKLVKLLKARGDVRGLTVNGSAVAGQVMVSSDRRMRPAGDLSHFRRVDLLRIVRSHEDFVLSAFQLLCALDASFRQFRSDSGEVDVVRLTEAVNRHLRKMGRLVR